MCLVGVGKCMGVEFGKVETFCGALETVVMCLVGVGKCMGVEFGKIGSSPRVLGPSDPWGRPNLPKFNSHTLPNTNQTHHNRFQGPTKCFHFFLFLVIFPPRSLSDDPILLKIAPMHFPTPT